MDTVVFDRGVSQQDAGLEIPMDVCVMTLLGLAEGDALIYLEEHGATTLRGLISALDWPASLVTMATGALIRQGLVRGIRHDLEIVLDPKG